jgi:hypothetical protein
MASPKKGSGCLTDLLVFGLLGAAAYYFGWPQWVMQFIRSPFPTEEVKPRSPAPAHKTPPALPSSPTISLPALTTVPTKVLTRLQFPFVRGRCYRVNQGNNGLYSHHVLSNRYAWDFSMEVGTPVNAAAAGQVISLPSTGEVGNSVVLDHGNGIYTIYAHLSKLKVKPGDNVRASQMIALSGQEPGQLPHLHYGAFALYPILTSLPSQLIDDKQDSDHVPRWRETYCATGGLEKRTNPITALRVNSFRTQGIVLRIATPAHVLTIGQSYRVEGQSDRPNALVHYQVRTARGEILTSQATYTDSQGSFGFNVRVNAGQPGEAVSQLLYSDPTRMGSTISAILVAR